MGGAKWKAEPVGKKEVSETEGMIEKVGFTGRQEDLGGPCEP